MIDLRNVVRGVDVSSAQGFPGHGSPPDFVKVGAAGYAFAIAKCIEGNATLPDPSFAGNWKNIADAGLVRGAYPFLHPDTVHTADAEDEARRCVARVGELGAADFIMGDLEDAATVAHGLPDGEPFLRWLVTWAETTESEGGKTPLIYTGGPYFAKHARKCLSPELLARVRRFPLVIAAYVDDPDRYVALTPWAAAQGWVIWQRSGDLGAHGVPGARVPGIACVVDEDIYRGSVDELRAFVAGLASVGLASVARDVATGSSAAGDATTSDGSNDASPLGRADRAEQEARDVAAATPDAPKGDG